MVFHLDERHCSGKDSKPHGTVGDADKHLELPVKTLLVAKEAPCRYHVSKTHCGECDEAEVGSRGNIPFLPNMEDRRAHDEVQDDGKDAEDDGDGDLAARHVRFLVQHFVPQLFSLSQRLPRDPLRNETFYSTPPHVKK